MPTGPQAERIQYYYPNECHISEATKELKARPIRKSHIYIYIHKRLETIESQVIEPGFVIEVTRAEQRDNEEIQCTAGNELPSSARARARIFKML